MLTSRASRRRQWHPTPVLLPGKSHGWRSLAGCSPWGHQEWDTTERLHFHFSLSCVGEGSGNPLQCSSLENPREGGAWWAAVYGVAQSRTRLKLLSSSSSQSFWTGRSAVVLRICTVSGSQVMLIPCETLGWTVFCKLRQKIHRKMPRSRCSFSAETRASAPAAWRTWKWRPQLFSKPGAGVSNSWNLNANLLG